jgi:hypothetical protein
MHDFSLRQLMKYAYVMCDYLINKIIEIEFLIYSFKCSIKEFNIDSSKLQSVQYSRGMTFLRALLLKPSFQLGFHHFLDMI